MASANFQQKEQAYQAIGGGLTPGGGVIGYSKAFALDLGQ